MQKIGKYEVLKKLGEGMTGSVFLCRDSFADRDVAVKLVSQSALKDMNNGRILHRLFLTEASLAGKLIHPHIVEIYDATADEDNAYIVMEYVGATNIAALAYQMLNQDPPLPSAFRRDIPQSIDAVVRRALERDLNRRYQSWREFSDDLVSAAAADEVIMKEGEPGGYFCILTSGQARVLRKGQLIATLEAGDCAGEMAYFGEVGRMRTADVVAASEVAYLRIGIEALERASELCRLHFDRAFLRILVERLTLANSQLTGV